MKAWPLLLFLLSACCPVPLQEQATAFRGVVAGTSPDSVLYLRTPDGPLITLVVPDGVRSSDGKTLPLTALRAGDAVYVRGRLRGGELYAGTVQRLE